jgi:hypothetical protein
MAVPQIGALAPIASAAVGQPSALGGIGESLANLPDTIAQKQLQRSTVQNEQSAQDDQRLQQITQMAQSNPAYAQHPELIKGVSDIYKRRGMPAPVVNDENGTRLDMNALMPHKQFGQLTEAEKTPYRALEIPQRSAELQAAGIQGVPTEFLSAKPYAPMSPGEGTEMLKMAAMGTSVLADPTKDPVLFAPMLRAIQGPLMKMGVDASAMLQPQIEAALQTRSQNAVAREVALGITAPAEAVKRSEAMIEYNKGRLANAVNETQIKGVQADTARKREEDQAIRTQGQLARWDVQNKGTLGNLQVAQQRVQTYAQMQGPAGAAGLMKYGKFLQSQLGQAQSGYDSLSNIAKGYTAAFQPVPQDILDRMGALKDQIDTITPLAGQAVTQAAATQAQMIRAQTGSAAVTPSGFGSGSRTELSRKTINGKIWVQYSDGKYDTVAQ